MADADAERTREGARSGSGESTAAAIAAALLPKPVSRLWAQPTLTLLSEGGEWLPHVDILEGLDAFTVLVDLPSIGSSDLSLTRSGANTRVRSGRRPPYGEGATELRGERLYGEFALSVRVPDNYEKRWTEGKLQNGVLRLSYRVDLDDEVIF